MKLGEYSKKYRAKGVGGNQTDIKRVVIHSAESPFGSAEGVARFLETREDGGAHFMLDDRSGYRLAPDSRIAYGVSGLNTGSIHIEQAGYAGMSKLQWLRHPRQLARVAYTTAHSLRKHNLPPRRLKGRDEVLHGKGYVYHMDASPYVTSTHTDPGKGFPTGVMDRLIKFYYRRPGVEKVVERG